ncbi:MAG: SUMF1/EgtB/PvdO family nonheme iron enzyme [Planctomycetes bacterium]|nr:SUMF1/EgtB/PvdO family nonheme iron enzyme [Planctomycetota bacterium]
MPNSHADRNLLFGILALQMDFISRDQLVEAMNAWVLAKHRPLGDLLVERGALASADYALLAPMVERHIAKHGGDPAKSLAVLSSVGPARDALAAIVDADVQASLQQVPAARQTPAEKEGMQTVIVPTLASAGTRYLIERPHAKGGLGEVFVARDQELNRKVALKQIQEQHAAQPESRARFLLEAEVTGQLEHPGIVPVYGLGSYADGRPFYAMRFVKGDSLKDAIAVFHQAEQAGQSASARSLGLRGLLGRFVDVCNAIAYAHSRGVLHRDLKPGNIMLGKYGETLVVDWGLAKVVGQADVEATEGALARSGDSALTQTGKALGTPAYMSPEQAAGRLDQLGPHSDVCSLGATLYCLLTGQAPFAEADVGAVLRKVQQGDFRPPRQVNRLVPAALEAVCLKAMALRPQDRYAATKDLADDVERWLADEPVSAYREPLRLRLARWRRRHPALVTGTAALVFTALVGLGVGSLLLSSEQARTLQEQQGKLDEQQKRALAQVDALLNATPKAVPTILGGLEPYRDQVRPRLLAVRQQAEPQEATEAARKLWQQHRTRAALALLPEDAEQLAFLRERLLSEDTEPEETLLLRNQMAEHGGKELAKELWAEASRDVKAGQRFRALVALARLDAKNPRWQAEGQEGAPSAGKAVVGSLLAAEPLHAAVWSAGLRDVKESLLAPLAEGFRDRERPAEQRLATSVLADYAADKPDMLATLLLDADPKQYAILFPVLQRYRDQAVQRMRQEIARLPQTWKDAPLDPAWQEPAEELRREVEQAEGLLVERWALCQALPLERVQAVTEGLRRSGYRPIRCRPYAAGRRVQTAAVWVRDGRSWEMVHDLTAEAVRQRDREQQKRQLRPVDVAGYLDNGRERYAVLWVQTDPKEDVRLYVGVADRDHQTAWQPLRKDALQPSTLHTLTLANGDERFSSVWRKPAPAGNASWSSNEQEHADQAALSDRIPLDVSLTIALREMVGEAVAWVAGSPWPALAWRSRQPVLAHPTLRYAGTWQTSATLEHVTVQGLDPAAHLARCRELAVQGYRPTAISCLPSPPKRGRGVGGEGIRLTASVWHRPVPKRDDQEQLARRQATSAVTLLKLEAPEAAWPLYRHRADPEARSQLLWRGGLLGLDPKKLVQRLEVEQDVTAQRALILALGEFSGEQLPQTVRGPLVEKLLKMYRGHLDPGIHGAIDWLLRHGKEGPDDRKLNWGQRQELERIDRALANKASPVPSGPGSKRWYVNGQGQTLVLVPGPVEFGMGSPPSDPDRIEGIDVLHRRRIPRSYALASRSVTVAEFERFLKDRPDVAHSYLKRYRPEADGPIISVTWLEAAQYCNWLSEKEGLAEKEWCYPKHEDIKDGMRLPADFLRRTGYRLPTEAEWEYACRAGAGTARSYGSSVELLPRYAWFQGNSQDRAWPVGQKRPNDLGLFDLHGNAWNWVADPGYRYPLGTGDRVIIDNEDLYRGYMIYISDSKSSRVLRGGSFVNRATNVRSAQRLIYRPASRNYVYGFRLARTVVNDGPPPRTREAP